MAGKRIGRPTRCNDALAKAIGRRVRGGVSLQTACDCERVNAQSVYEWFHKGTGLAAREPYQSFTASLKRDLADARATAEERVFAGELQWQSSARWLESMDPATWRRTERREVDVSGALEIPWPDLAKPGIEGARAAARRSRRPERA